MGRAIAAARPTPAVVGERLAVADEKLDAMAVGNQQCRRRQAADVLFALQQQRRGAREHAPALNVPNQLALVSGFKTPSRAAKTYGKMLGLAFLIATVAILAQYALEQEKDKAKAQEYAESALKLAYCDGPPYYYKVAYEEAERMLAKL